MIGCRFVPARALATRCSGRTRVSRPARCTGRATRRGAPLSASVERHVTFRRLVQSAPEVIIHELTPRSLSSCLRSRRLRSPRPLQHARSPDPGHHSGGGFRASHRHRDVPWRRHRGTRLGTFAVVRGAAAWRSTSARTGRGPVRCRASGENHVWYSDASRARAGARWSVR